MQEKVQWQLMTWQEIQEVQRRNPVVLIPAGTIETQGMHTFVGLETVVPQRLAEEVARRTNSLVAPTIPFGYSSLFQDFPGTITLRPDVLAALYEDVVRSILRHGFDHVLFLAMHVPNHTMVRIVAEKIRDELGVLIAWLDPAELTSALLKEVSPNYAVAHGHGADPGLSLAKHLEPDMVDLSGAAPSQVNQEYRGLPLRDGKVMVNNLRLNLALRYQEVSPRGGGRADPSYASAAQGELIFSRAVGVLCEAVREFAAMNTRLNQPAAVERPI